MIEVKILGCGSSLGVPVIACECKVCNSDLIYNKRTRCAIVIKNEISNILIDFGYEIREQLLKAKIKTLDAAILTHHHADHVSGIDNLRTFSYIQHKPLKIITDTSTANILNERYQYLFNNKTLVTNPIEFESKINIGEIELQFFRQYHAPTLDSLGIKVKNFAYTNDVKKFPIESEKFLYNLENWVLDCRGYNSNDYHIGFDQMMDLYKKFKPKNLYLTNMSHEIDYYNISLQLPPNIMPLYDGFEIKIEK